MCCMCAPGKLTPHSTDQPVYKAPGLRSTHACPTPDIFGNCYLGAVQPVPQAAGPAGETVPSVRRADVPAGKKTTKITRRTNRRTTSLVENCMAVAPAERHGQSSMTKMTTVDGKVGSVSNGSAASAKSTAMVTEGIAERLKRWPRPPNQY